MNDSGLDAGYVEKKRAKFLWEEVVRFIFLNAPFYCLVRQVDDVSLVLIRGGPDKFLQQSIWKYIVHTH